MKTNFPLWLSPVSIGAGIVMVNVGNVTVPYTPPDASLNTLLTGELFVPAQVPIPGAPLIKGLGFGMVGLGLAQMAAYAFAGTSGTSKSKIESEMPLALTEDPAPVAAPPPPPPIDSPVEAFAPEPIASEMPLVEPVIRETITSEMPLAEPVLREFIASETPSVEPLVGESAIPEIPQAEPLFRETVTSETPSAEPVIRESAIPETPSVEPLVGESAIPEIPQAEPLVRETITPEIPRVESSSIPSPLLPLGIVSDIVEAVTRDESSQHAAIASLSRGGKSYTLRAIIWGIEQIYPNATVRVVDGKDSAAGWLGLEKMPGVVKLADRHLQPALEAIDEAISLLDNAIGTRNRQGKAYFVFDEWNDILDRARQLDANMNGTPGWQALYPDLLYKMGRLVVQGLDYGIHLILSVRSCRCEEFGFPPQLGENFAIAALARQERYEMLSSLLESPHLLPDAACRQQLTEQAQEAIVRSQSVKCPLLMTAGDRARVEEVPDLEWLDWVDLSAFSEAQTDDEVAPNQKNAMDVKMTEAPTLERIEAEEPIEIAQGTWENPFESGPLTPAAVVETEDTTGLKTQEEKVFEPIETDVFERIQEAVASGETSASRLIKSVVKCTDSQKYRTVIKSGLQSGTRKYRSTDVVAQFQSYLDK